MTRTSLWIEYERAVALVRQTHDQGATYMTAQGRCVSSMETRKSMTLDADWLNCTKSEMSVKEGDPFTQVPERERADAIR